MSGGRYTQSPVLYSTCLRENELQEGRGGRELQVELDRVQPTDMFPT